MNMSQGESMMKIASLVLLAISVLCVLCLACCVPAYYNFYGGAANGYKWMQVLFVCVLYAVGAVEVITHLLHRENNGVAVFLYSMAIISAWFALLCVLSVLIVVIDMPCLGFLKYQLDPNGIFPVAIGVVFAVWLFSVSLRCVLRARMLAQGDVSSRDEQLSGCSQKKTCQCTEGCKSRNNPYVAAVLCCIIFFGLLSYSPLLAIVFGFVAIIRLLVAWFSRG